MPAAILVTNLPRHCTESDVRRSFSRFGAVWRVVLLEDYADDVRYFLRSAYVFYAAPRALSFFSEDDADVVVGDCLAEVLPADGAYVAHSVLVLGVCRCLTERRLRERLRLCDRASVAIERPPAPARGFARVQFAGADAARLFLDAHAAGAPGACGCGARLALRRFPAPAPLPRVASVARGGARFLRVLGAPRFCDYTVATPDGDFAVCARVFAACSRLVADHVARDVWQTRLELSGDYRSVIRAVYGAPLRVTGENCEFVHGFGSHFGIDALIEQASLVKLDGLTMQNALGVARAAVKAQLDLRFIGEYLAVRSAETKEPLSRRLPIEIVRAVAGHPAMEGLTKANVEAIFREFLPPLNRAGISLADIGCTDLAQMDFDSNRALLVDYLDNHRVRASGNVPPRAASPARAAAPSPPARWGPPPPFRPRSGVLERMEDADVAQAPQRRNSRLYGLLLNVLEDI
jgi:hypothetical protein